MPFEIVPNIDASKFKLETSKPCRCSAQHSPAQATACAVDKAPRKNERPSDHAPVVLTFEA